MKGNVKIGITGEMVAFIRAQKGDKLSERFVTSRVCRLYNLISLIFSRKKIEEIFEKRIALSNLFFDIVMKFKPDQVVELASGSSVLGLRYLEKNSSAVYVESDFSEVVAKKKEILGVVSKNHCFVGIDVLSDDIYSKVKKLVSRGKKTLVVAEGLTTYFSQAEFDKLVVNIANFLERIGGGAFLAHDRGSFSGGFLRKFIGWITRSKSYSHFSSVGEVKDYFRKRGFKKVKIAGRDPLVYLVE